MRLSDLLNARVVDEAGRSAGKVHDVRLVQDGPVQGTFGAALRVHGLVVGPPLPGTRLGFDRTGVRGPFLLKAPIGRLHRRLRYVPWSQVLGVEAGEVRISGSVADLAPPERLAS
jgi:hypothetical protein